MNEDIKVWPDAQERTSWMRRFIEYLKERGRLQDLTFVSFEHYPYEPCEINWTDLYREQDLVKHILQVWRDDGVRKNVPLMNTESNVSWALTSPMTENFAALWLADSVGAFLSNGGAAYYHSSIQPEPLRSGCHGYSTATATAPTEIMWLTKSWKSFSTLRSTSRARSSTLNG